MSLKESDIVINKTKGKLPSLPFVSITKAILGKDYEISVVFVSKAKSRIINSTYRGKDYATNVLSFPLTKKSGEIIMCADIMKKEHTSFDMNYKKFVTFLFIHGCLHLKGMEHSSTMEKEEKKFLKKFS
jgi:probable rRNA maturation factor